MGQASTSAVYGLNHTATVTCMLYCNQTGVHRGSSRLTVSNAAVVSLQDDEVDRLERSSRPGGWLGLGRQDVMDSIYGRVDPRPAGEISS